MMSSFGGGAAADDDEDGGKARTDEEIFSEIAADLVAKLPPLCDIGAVQRAYPVKYDQCLNTVLLMELGKFNKLLNTVTSTLVNLGKAVKGLVVFSPELEEVGHGCLVNCLPGAWMKNSYPSLKPLQSYVDDHLLRWKFMNNWIKDGIPTNFWFSAYFFQQAFLTGVLQNFARKDKIAIDRIMWNFRSMKKVDKCDEEPDRGAYIYGLYLNGARWDDDNMVVADSFPKVLWDTMNNLWLRPVEIDKDEHDYDRMYACPCYKTSERKGVLSTSGHSSNFIMWMYLNCAPEHNETFWTKRGVAFISQTDD
jgi:dynein heavy chain